MSARNHSTVLCTHEAWALKTYLAREHGLEISMLWDWVQGNPHSHLTGLYAFYPQMAINTTPLSEETVVTGLRTLEEEGLSSACRHRRLAEHA